MSSGVDEIVRVSGSAVRHVKADVVCGKSGKKSVEGQRSVGGARSVRLHFLTFLGRDGAKRNAAVRLGGCRSVVQTAAIASRRPRGGTHWIAHMLLRFYVLVGPKVQKTRWVETQKERRSNQGQRRGVRLSDILHQAHVEALMMYA